MNQTCPNYSAGHNSSNKILKITYPKTVDRRLLGIPVNALIFLLVVFSVLGASAYIKGLGGSLKIVSSDYSGFTPIDFASGTQLNMSGGESIMRTFRISNTDTTNAMDGQVTLDVSNVNQGECKIWLRDSANVELGEDFSVVGDTLSVSATYTNILPSSYKDGKFEVQCNPDVNKTINFNVSMTPISKFTFKE